MTKAKLYKNLQLLLRVAFPALVIALILSRVSGDIVSISEWQPGNLIWIIIAIVLVVVNWGIETVKWKTVMDNVQPMDYKPAFTSVLFGTSLSLFTPNRIGELGGRLLLIDKKNRAAALLVNVFNSLCQLLVTVFFGLLSVIYLKNEFVQIMGEKAWLYVVNTFGIIFLIAIIAFILKKFIFHQLSGIKLIQKYSNKLSTMVTIAGKEWKITLLLSALRYFVFSLQYILLLRYFGIGFPFFTALTLISCVFFINTIVPGSLLMELGVRSSAALFLFGMYSANNTGILAATLLLWLINLAFPALFGLLLVRKKDLNLIGTVK